MQLLAAIGDVDDLVGVPGFDAVRQGGQVGGGVVEAAVALLDDERIGNPLAFFMDEEGSSFGGTNRRTGWRSRLGSRGRCPRRISSSTSGLQARMVEALAQGVVELHAQPADRWFRTGPAKARIISRQIARFSASPRCSFTNSAARPVQRGRVETRLLGIALRADRLVKALHLGERIGLEARACPAASSSRRATCRTACPSRRGDCR